MEKTRYLVVGMIILLLYHQTVTSSAKHVLDTGKISDIQLNIPEKGIQYFEEDYVSLLKCTIGDPDIGKLKEKDMKNIKIGVPYIVYVSSGDQDPIYYFPLYWKNKICYVYDLSWCKEGYSMGISEDMVDVLNRVDYLHHDTIFYEYQGEIVAENADRKRRTGYSLQTVEANDAGEQAFYRLSFRQKKRKIEQRAKELKAVQYRNIIFHNRKNKREVKLNLHIPQGQYKYDMCWACVAATIVNYKNDSSYTGFEVCSRMGIGYNAGGNIYDIKDAMRKYGVYYSYIKNEMLAWNKIKENINCGYPIAAGTGTGGNLVGHAVTVYGYRTVDSKRQVRVWDSYLEKQNGGWTYKNYGSGEIAKINQKIYYWEQSLHYK